MIASHKIHFEKNTVYAEFGGNGIDWSANYERQLGKKPGLGVRAGMGYASSTEEFRISVPIGVNYLFDISPSSDLLQHLPVKHPFNIRELGSIELRGKKNKIELSNLTMNAKTVSSFSARRRKSAA
jgi:hypothetical protein